MRSTPLMSESDVLKVTKAVEDAERRTSGEIVPLVLRQSDSYPGARWRWAIAFTWAATFALVLLEPGLHPIWFLWAQAPALALGYAIGSVPALQRSFLARAEMDEEVRQRALEAFHFHQLHQTQGRTGVLILISLLEHRVEVLADRGISEKVSREKWDGIVTRLTTKMRDGAMVEGLCGAIAECGELLTKEFPAREGERNELPDYPRFES